MTSRSGAELPQLEIDCLAILWSLDAGPVADVHARLAQRGRPLAYTTVLTVLERLVRKGAVARQRRGRAYVYTPQISRDEMRERALTRLVGNYFDSRHDLRRYLGLAPENTAPPEPRPEPSPESIEDPRPASPRPRAALTVPVDPLFAPSEEVVLD